MLYFYASRGTDKLPEAIAHLAVDTVYIIKPRAWGLEAVVKNGPSHYGYLLRCVGLDDARRILEAAKDSGMFCVQVADNKATDRDVRERLSAVGLEVVETKELTTEGSHA